jgi:hypothetical protein
MAENVDARNLDAPAAAAPGDFYFPHDLLFSIFESIMPENPTFARETFPLLNRDCSETFRSPHGSRLCETVHVDFSPREDGRHLHAASAVAWLVPRAEAVRKLVIHLHNEDNDSDMDVDDVGHHTGEAVAAILRVVGPHLTELAVEVDLEFWRAAGPPLWRSLSAVVAPAANLRSLCIEAYILESEKDPPRFGEREPQALARLTSLEKLVLNLSEFSNGSAGTLQVAACSCTRLRHLEISIGMESCYVPDQISSLQHLETLSVSGCACNWVPAELGALTGLTRLELIADVEHDLLLMPRKRSSQRSSRT